MECLLRLSELSTTDLFCTVEQASAARDSVLLFGYLGAEMRRRIRAGQIEASVAIEQLQSIPPRDDLAEFFMLNVLNSGVQGYSPTDLKRLFSYSWSRSKGLMNDRNENRLAAMIVASHSLSRLIATGNANPEWVADYGQELTAVATVSGEDPELRRVAIKGIREIEFRDAIPALMALANDTTTRTCSPVIRSTCIALSDFGVNESVDIIGGILSSISDEYIFSSAATALGDIGGIEALKYLVQNENRFDEGCVDIAIRKQTGLIFALLHSNNAESQSIAIEASFFLNKQEHIALVKSILMDMLRTESSRVQTELILRRLKPIIDQSDAKKILNVTSARSLSSSETQWLESFSVSRAIPPAREAATFTPDKNDSYSIVQEYGDPGYRENSIGWGLFGWLGHTGLCAGVDSEGHLRCVEVGQDGDNGGGIYDNNWSRMIDNPNDLEFWGSYQPSNRRLSFEERRNVMDTATEFIGRDIGYPTLALDILNYTTSPGLTIDVDEVKDLRCDGLVEYAYERNGLWVWGKDGSNYDVSVTANLADHDILYAIEQVLSNPNTGTAPVVQCGLEGGASTYMTEDAVIHLPEYHFSYSASKNIATAYVKATDESGIHQIFCKPQNYANWIEGDIRSQHPVVDYYRQEFVFVLPVTQGYYDVQVYAIDNGGNGGPEFAETYQVFICEDSPDVVQNMTPVDGAAGVDQDICFDWDDIPGATDYRIQYGLEESYPTACDDVVISDPALSYYCPIDLKAGKRYWWRVRVWTDCGNSGWSPYRWFTTTCSDVEPPEPYATSECPPVYIAFPPVPGAIGYLYQADCFGTQWWLNNSWDDTLVSTCGLGPVTLNLRTISDCDTSEIVSIDIFKYSQPDRPVLLGPDSGAFDIDLPITLSWQDGTQLYAGAITEYYELQLDDDSLFSTIGTETVADTALLASGLSGGRMYYWRVRSCNTCYCSSWSKVSCFTPSCVVPTQTYPLISPLVNAMNISWEDIEGADMYEVSISQPTPFGDTALTTSKNSLRYILPLDQYDLSQAGKYVVGLRCANACGYSAKETDSVDLFHIAGQVVSSSDGEALATAWVYINSYGSQAMSDPGIDSTLTNEAGLYRFVVEPGSYQVWRDNVNGDIYDAVVIDGSFEGKNFIGAMDIFEIENSSRPSSFCLGQNYPNPFNPVTQIEFDIQRSCFVRVQIYDVLGQQTRTLVNERLSPGRKVVTWDGTNDSGQPVASGVYFYRIITESYSESKKMLLLR